MLDTPIKVVCAVCGSQSTIRTHAWIPKWGLSPFCRKCTTPERLTALREKYAISGRKKAQATYAHTPKGENARATAQIRYVQTENGKEAIKQGQIRYALTEKGKKARRKAQVQYAQTERGKKALREAQARFRQKRKTSVVSSLVCNSEEFL